MLFATTVLMIVAVLVGFDINSWPGLFAAVGLAAVFASSIMWVFLTLGVIMKNAQSVQAMGFLVLLPLQFGSSIFAPTAIDARLAAGVHRLQPAVHARGRGPRADGGRPGRARPVGDPRPGRWRSPP